MSETDRATPEELVPVRLRLGHGANCSSIGSVLDLLFASAAIGSAIFAAAAAAARDEATSPAPPPGNAEPSSPGEPTPSVREDDP